MLSPQIMYKNAGKGLEYCHIYGYFMTTMQARSQ